MLAIGILAPLSLIGLCLATYYFNEVACVLAWWTMTVVVIFITLGVAGWNYIRETLTRQPEKKQDRLEIDLADLWWKSIAPELPAGTRRQKKKSDFLSQLEEQIPDTCLMIRNLLPSAQGGTNADVLLVSTSGLWLFTICHEEGRIRKQNGAWKQKLKREPEKELEPAPDSRWIQQKETIRQVVLSRAPALAWCLDLVQGGIVFSHPKAILNKAEIVDHKAPYGPGKAWIDRLQHATPDERFSIEVQLELLDLFITQFRDEDQAIFQYLSSRDEAERLFEQANAELRALVEKLMN